MQRRDFIRGLLISTSAVASTALVKLASPDEARALVPQRSVFIGQPELDIGVPGINAGGYVYMKDQRGEFKPIGIVTSLTINCAVDEVVRWDGTVCVMPGLKETDLQFQGPFVR